LNFELDKAYNNNNNPLNNINLIFLMAGREDCVVHHKEDMDTDNGRTIGISDITKGNDTFRFGLFI